MNNSLSGLSNLELKARIFGVGMINPNERFKKQEITDMPILINKSGKVICIPNSDEVRIIGVTGATGTCKSVAMNMLLSMDYWLFKNDCLVLNDMQKETFEWSEPAEKKTFNHQKVNMTPCPTPIVYVLPSTNTLRIDEKITRYPYIKMTLPIKEVVKNIQNYIPSELKNTELYLTNLTKEFEECNSMSEIKEVIKENIPEKHEMMKFKLINIFEKVFSNNILNVSQSEAPAFLKYKDIEEEGYFNTTVQTLLRARLVPSIQTWDLGNQDYFAPYISYILNTLYNNQYEDDYFKTRKVSLFVDEIDKLWRGDNGEIVKKSLCIFGTNGRAARVGLRWSTQHYDTVPQKIRANTKYLIVSRKNDSKEVNEIRKDFNVPKSIESEILDLKSDPNNGIFNIALLTTEKLITYDLTTGKKDSTNEPQVGQLINPLARHYIPKYVKAKKDNGI